MHFSCESQNRLYEIIAMQYRRNMIINSMNLDTTTAKSTLLATFFFSFGHREYLHIKSWSMVMATEIFIYSFYGTLIAFNIIYCRLNLFNAHFCVPLFGV